MPPYPGIGKTLKFSPYAQAARIAGFATYHGGKYLGKKLIKKWTGTKAGPKDQTARTNEAEADIGYGIHETKRLYTSRSGNKRKRKNPKRSRRLKQSKRFAKKVKKTLRSKYLPQYTILNSTHELTHGTNSQGIQVVSSGTGRNGAVTDDEQNNDLNTLVFQNGLSQSEADIAYSKVYLHSIKDTLLLYNKSDQNVTVSLYECMTKTKKMAWDLEKLDVTVEDKVFDYSSVQNMITENVGVEWDLNACVTQAVATTPGYSPFYSKKFKKHFKLTKLDKFEMSSGAHISLDKFRTVKKEMTNAVMNNVHLIPGVTVSYVFVVRSYPDYIAAARTNGTSFTANNGIWIARTSIIKWQQIDGSYETGDTKQKKIVHVSEVAFGSAQTTSPITMATA